MAQGMSPKQLVKVLRAEGLTVKTYSGYTARCRCHAGSHSKGGRKIRSWGPVNGTMVHITAGNKGARTVNQYIRDIINGDPSVPYKAQIVISKNGTVYVNGSGRANHAGLVSSAGLRRVVKANFSTKKAYDPTRGSNADGNSRLYGIENIAASKMSKKQRAASVLVCAAIARHHGWSGQESVGHGEISASRSAADPNLHMGKFRTDVMKRVKSKSHKPTGSYKAPTKKHKKTKKKAKAPTAKMNPKSYFIGAKGSQVTWLGKRLVAHGFGKYYKVGPGPNFTNADRKAVAAFQRSQGWSGKDADGFPGKQSLSILAKAPKKKKKKSKKLSAYKPSQFYIGAKGAHVTKLGKALVRHGFGKYYKVGPGPNFTNADRKAVAAFQRSQGWRGKDADGFPGKQSLKRLSK